MTAVVTMRTSLGDITLELYGAQAPTSVRNFLAYVEGGKYNRGAFHRVVTYKNDNGNPKIEIIQGGADARIRELPPIAHESTMRTGLAHVDGTISMSRLGLGTATSDFFICVGDQPALNHGSARHPDKQGFAAFGKVVAGFDVVRTIHGIRDTVPEEEGSYSGNQILANPVQILEAVLGPDPDGP